MADPNPYPSDSPEWQLHANMIGAEAAARAYDADAMRATKHAEEQREKERKFRAALTKLTSD